MSIKLDLHIHTESHGKTFITSEQLNQSLIQNDIDGVAITNFFDISHAVWIKKRLKDRVVIVGQEIWTKYGHIIGLGLREQIPDSLSAEETIGIIHEQGGIAVAPHPYLFLGIKERAVLIQIDAIEVYNGLLGYAVIFNYLAKRMAKKSKITQIASTDTTDPKFIGLSYTEVLANNPNDIFKAIKAGRVKLKRRAVPLPTGFILKNLLNFSNFEPSSVHAVPCYICGKSMAVRILKKIYFCSDCGKAIQSRIVCCNKHYLCTDCILKRGSLSVQKKYC